MANTCFAFKQFTIYHDQCAMKVGTDGVMLGAWVNISGAKTILDVGTGTGLIAIMMAQRCNASIDAVEIDETACRQARENVQNCPWSHRIRIIHDSLQHYTEGTSVRYDVIVSNPPFFRDSLKPALSGRSVARHDEKLNFESLLFYSSRLLQENGLLSVIIPAADRDHFTNLAYFHNLHPVRQTLIRPVAGKTPSRCMAEFSKDKNSVLQPSELLIKKEDGEDYSDDFKGMTRDFYLKM